MNIQLNTDEKITEINFGLKLIEKTGGLTYGTDAFLLAAYMRRKPHRIMADFGSGTGIVSLLAAASNKAAKIYSVEVQESFADLIARNAELNCLSGTVTPICSDVRELKLNGELDTVMSNPPYMLTGNGRRNSADEKYIARHEVMGGISDFCQAAAKALKTGGEFICVFRPDRLIDLISAMRDSKLEPKIMTFVHSDTDTAPSLVLIEAKKSAGGGLICTPPLIIYKSSTEREYTDDMNYIYKNLDFPDKFRPVNK